MILEQTKSYARFLAAVQKASTPVGTRKCSIYLNLLREIEIYKRIADFELSGSIDLVG